MSSNLIDIDAENMIIEQEVSGKSLYVARYQKPTWPGGSSGATIAIGVDIGYTSHDELEHDWSGRISDAMIGVLHQAVGVKGEAAHALVHSANTFWLCRRDSIPKLLVRNMLIMPRSPEWLPSSGGTPPASTRRRLAAQSWNPSR